MTRTFRDRPIYRLTRHFFGSLFDFGFLSDEGSDSFQRTVAGICGLAFTLGLLLARVYLAKYANLSASGDLEFYRAAILADEAFLIAVPMWIGAVATVVIGHAVFPDEQDFRVLMVLPITKRLVFTAKVCAVGLFTGLFLLAGHVLIAPLLLVMWLRRWTEVPISEQAVTFLVSSTAGSVFAVFGVIAVNGLLLLTAPRDRLIAASATLRSLMLAALVVAFPFVGRLSNAVHAFANGAGWLSWVPPAWFVGLERVLAGSDRPYFGRLAVIGGLTFGLTVLLACTAYALLYRHFDRVMVRPSAGMPSRLNDHGGHAWRLPGLTTMARPALAAVQRFTFITLRRSVLHQGIVVALSAVGLGLVVNSLSGTGAFEWLTRGVTSTELVDTVIWAPFVLIYALCLAIRVGLSVPIEQRANWVFRVTEADAVRVDQLRAAVRTVVILGVAAPIAVFIPVQWLLLGPQAIVAAVVTYICGLLFVELLMRDWARIPFTCSYIPGKGFVPQMLMKGLAAYVLFTTLGSALVHVALRVGSGALVPLGVLCAVVWGLNRRRTHRWKETPLLFEDVLPTEVNPLRLSVD